MEEKKKETALEGLVQEQCKFEDDHNFVAYIKEQQSKFRDYLENWSKSKRASFSE